MPDGGLVVAGVAGDDAFVAHHLPDGTLDPRFGQGGRLLLRVAALDAVQALLLADDGALVLAGTASRAHADGGRDDGALLVARVLPDGRLDATFATAGVARAVVPGRSLRARALASDHAGGVVVAGSAGDRDGDDLLLLHLRADGTPDPALGPGGLLVADLGTPGDTAHAVAVQRDGRIVVAGEVGGAADRDLLVARFAAGGARCGDGVVGPGESCDHGARNGAAGSCCSATCTPLAAAAVCRPSAGACDPAESCDGTSARCPDDAVSRAGAPCRAAAGSCDVAEVCDGTAPQCPADALHGSGALCRVATGACDLDEKCDGKTPACPADRKRTAECRASRGACDPAEWCDGVGNDCPEDAFLPDGAACDDGDACTVDDACEGASCHAGPRDAFACSAYLCSMVKEKRQVSGTSPSAADLGGALGHEVLLHGLRSVCVPAFTGAAETAGDAASDPEELAGDERPAYVNYGISVRRPGQRRGHAAIARGARSVTVEDQFGAFDIDVQQARSVSLPAVVGSDASLAAAPGGATYQCHQMALRGARRGSVQREVSVRVATDGSSRRYAVSQPRRVCQAVAGAAADDGTSQDDLLLCYDAKPLGPQDEAAPARLPLLARNAFEGWLVEQIGQQHLCVPALLTYVTEEAEKVGESTPVPRKRHVKRPRRDPERRPAHRKPRQKDVAE